VLRWSGYSFGKLAVFKSIDVEILLKWGVGVGEKP